jgi:hypothetical protein
MKIVRCTFELICRSAPQNDREYLPVASILSCDNFISVRGTFCSLLHYTWSDNKVRELNTQTLIDATQKETAIDQQHGCETLICQRHQTILRFLSRTATASTW